MALTITHAHVATGTDAGNGEVHKAEWNANHAVSGTLSADDTVDGTTNKVFTGTEKTKLSGIASGATANSSDATLLARANHTGTQTASTISDFNTTADGRITAAVDVTVQAYDADTAKLDVEDQTLTGGARVTRKDLGSTTGTTITPDPGDRGHQKVSNNGAWTLAPGSNYGTYNLIVINTTGAAVPTTSGWTKVEGAFDATTTSKFLCTCVVDPDFSYLGIIKIA